MYSRKRPDSQRFMGGRSHVFCFHFKSLGTLLFSTTAVKVVGTSHTSGGLDHKYPAFAHTICLRKMPHSVAICIKYQVQTRMNHDIHYVSICWTFVFVSHCILPDRLHSRRQCPNARSLSVNLSLFIQCFFSIFSLDATLKCILSAVILSRFGHRPGYYTTIDFRSGLDNPSDLDLVTAHATCSVYNCLR